MSLHFIDDFYGNLWKGWKEPMNKWYFFLCFLVFLSLGSHPYAISQHAVNTLSVVEISCDPHGGCDGLDPYGSGCWLIDGTIIASTTWTNDLAQNMPMETDLLWSRTCGTKWAHSYVTASHPQEAPIEADIFSFCTAEACSGYSIGTYAVEESTPMLFVGTQVAYACGYPTVQYHLGGKCTNRA